MYVTGPILESKESVRYVQKGYPTLVTKLTWFSKIDIWSKQVIQLCTPFMVLCNFYNFSFPLGDSWETLVMVEGEI